MWRSVSTVLFHGQNVTGQVRVLTDADCGVRRNGKESILFPYLSPNVSDWFAVRAVSFPPRPFILECSRVAYCCNPKIHVTRFPETSGNFLPRSSDSRSKRTFVGSVDIKTCVNLLSFPLSRLVSHAHEIRSIWPRCIVSFGSVRSSNSKL